MLPSRAAVRSVITALKVEIDASDKPANTDEAFPRLGNDD